MTHLWVSKEMLSYGSTIHVYSGYNNGCVIHIVALPFTLKSMLIKEKEEELWKLKYFTIQKYNLQKNPLKKQTKILQDIS
jgi:hypothetical protein